MDETCQYHEPLIITDLIFVIFQKFIGKIHRISIMGTSVVLTSGLAIKNSLCGTL